MSWNYRIIYHPAGAERKIPYEEYYGLHEVYYNKKEKPHLYTEEPLLVIDGLPKDAKPEEVTKRFKVILDDIHRGIKEKCLQESDFNICKEIKKI